MNKNIRVYANEYLKIKEIISAAKIVITKSIIAIPKKR